MFIPQWLIDWVVETVQRWKMKRPKYFVYMSRIGDILVMITGIPSGIVELETAFKFTAPEFLEVLANKFAFGAGMAISIVARLTVKATVVAQTNQGDAVTVMDKTKMPITEKSEAKDLELTKPPPEVIEEIPEAREMPPPKEN